MVFWDFLKSYDVGKFVSQLGFTIFITTNHFSFHLLWKKHLVKYLQVPKCFMTIVVILEVALVGHGAFNAIKI